MNELSRNLLSSAREGMSPDAAAMARVRAKVAASVAAAGAGSVVVVPAKASAGVGVKLAAAALAIAAVTVAVVMVRAPSSRVESPHVAVAPLEVDEPASAIHMASPESQVAAGPAVTVPRAPIASTPAAITPAASAPAATAEPVSLAREVELVDKAMLLVRRGDARDAIAVIATYDRETRGQGQMAEDAAAIDIEARCKLREDVTARLAAFDRAWPSSAQRSRLQTACFWR